MALRERALASKLEGEGSTYVMIVDQDGLGVSS